MGKIVVKLIKLFNSLIALLPLADRKVYLDYPYVSADLGNCGIACVAMITSNVAITELGEKYKHLPYYQTSVGWSHPGLVQILSDYGQVARSKKAMTLVDLKNSIFQGKPVIVSLIVPHPQNLKKEVLYESNNPNAKNSGHLCLVVGFDAKGFFLHDPRNTKGYAADVAVPYSRFAAIFSGNGIVVG